MRLGIDRFAAWCVPSSACLFTASILTVLLLVMTAFESRAPGPDASGSTTLGSVPPSALAKISSIIGQDQPAYFAKRDQRALVITHPHMRLSASFTASGIVVWSGKSEARMALRAYGFGHVLHAMPAVNPLASNNRIVYRRGTLTEWYVHGPLGLEQGFTLAAPPAGDPRLPLSLELAVTGNAVPHLDASRQAISFPGPGLTYTGLWAVDARGRELPASLEVQRGAVLIHVQAADAVYPVTIDPLFTAAALTVSPTLSSGQLGFDVAISGDTIAVGAPETSGEGSGTPIFRGAIYVFVKPASGWANMTQTARLTASDGVTSDLLGSSVAMYGDVIVGTSRHGIYVFVKPPTGWSSATQSAKLTRSDRFPAQDQLIGDVAIYDDLIAAQAAFEVVPGAFRPRVYLWARGEFGWPDQQETLQLVVPVPVAGLGPIALSNDTLVAGEPSFGVTFVWNRPATGWLSLTESSQPADLTASDSGSDDMGFGSSVGVYGNYIVVGAPQRGRSSSFAFDGEGAVYLFERPASGAWTNSHEASLLTAAIPRAFDTLGGAVAIDGDRVLASGARVESPFGFIGNGVYLFKRSAGVWGTTEDSRLLTASGPIRSLATQGTTIVAGDPTFFPIGNFSRGRAFVLADDVTPPVTSIALTPSTPNGSNGWYTASVLTKVTANDEAGGSRVFSTHCELNPPTAPASFDDVAVCDGTYQNGAFVGTGEPVGSDGQHTLYAVSRDVAGNIESVKSKSFKIDTVPPTTTIDSAPAPDGLNGWNRTDVHVSVVAFDNANGSELAQVRCQLDPATAPTTFNDLPGTCGYAGAGANVTNEGQHTVYAASNDLAGLIGGVVSHSFRLDKTAPTVTCRAMPTFLLHDTGTVFADVTDGISGPAAAVISTSADTSTAGKKTAPLTGFDLAGNSATEGCDYIVAYVVQGPFAPFPLVTYAPGLTVPIRLALADALSTRISDPEAQALAASCNVQVTFDSDIPGCASYQPAINSFNFNLQIPKTATSGNHLVTLRALIAGNVVNAQSFAISVK